MESLESLTSRERPSSDHTLRVLVRIDTQLRLACLEVRGCLTPATCSTLMNILTHTGALGAAVSVNLLRAAHVEREALELLREGADPAVFAGAGAAPALSARPAAGLGGSAADPPYDTTPADLRSGLTPVAILVPPELPVCRLGPVPAAPGSAGLDSAGHALTNEEAADLILQRDPRVLADRSGQRPRKP